MRILLIAALVSSVAVAGCRGGEKNTSTSANNSASSNGSASASGGGSGSAADAFRQLATSQCEQTIRSNPSAPPGFDAAGTCNCAIQSAFGNQADPVAFAKSPEGRQALTQAIVTCGQQRMGGAAGAQTPADGNAAEAEEEGEEK
jgi:hypothetical protein